MKKKVDLNGLIKFDILESSELGSSQGDSLEVNPAQGSIGQLMSVYVIQNLYHKKYYVGETLNTRNRISEHWNSFIKGSSIIKELQDDVNEIKNENIKLEDAIKFTLVFYKFFVFADKAKRSGVFISVSVNGIIYPNLTQAAKVYKVSRKTMTSWYKKGKNTKGDICKFV